MRFVVRRNAWPERWKQQTLLNIVKLRYFDTPTFLDVSSIISSYQLQGELRFEREFFRRAPADTNRTLGMFGTYTDRPTIFYAPLSTDRPEDAFSDLYYRKHWFWIDDRDLPSKRVFTFLKHFSSIAETGVAPHLPVVTVPAT